MSIRARREVAGFKERGDPSEGAWNGNGISSHFERDGFRRAGHKSVEVCVPRGNWSGNKAISDFTPETPDVSTKVSSSRRSIFEGSPSSARYLAKIGGERVEEQNPSSNEVGSSYTYFPFSSLFTEMAFHPSLLYQFFLLMSLT